MNQFPVPDEDRCSVCGVMEWIRTPAGRFPFSQTHIWGPVTDVGTGRDYPGHPVEDLSALEREV